MMAPYWTHVATLRQQESSRFRREPLTTCELQRNGLLTKHISAPNAHGLEKSVNPAALVGI